MIQKFNLNSAGRLGLVAKKYSPQILLGSGVVGVIASAVWACDSTLKAQSVVKYGKALMQDFTVAAEDEENSDYSEEEATKDRIVVSIQVAAELTRLYAAPIILGGVSLGMLVQSHNILNKRNAALAGAYKVLDEGFKAYRGRVVDEFGVGLDNYLRFQTKEERKFKVVEDKKGGKEIVFETQNEVGTDGEVNILNPSEYAKYFDESSPQWRRDNDQNMYFLKAQQTWANHKLQAEGFLLLNEVYEALGIPRTSTGAIVGWVKDMGDNAVDFGLYDANNGEKRDFINGYNVQAFLLDFNVQGVVYDLI